MADIQSATAEIRRGKKEERRRRNHRAKKWSALFHRATIINLLDYLLTLMLLVTAGGLVIIETWANEKRQVLVSLYVGGGLLMVAQVLVCTCDDYCIMCDP